MDTVNASPKVFTTPQDVMKTLAQNHFEDLRTVIDSHKRGKLPGLNLAPPDNFLNPIVLKSKKMTRTDTYWGKRLLQSLLDYSNDVGDYE